MFLIHRLMILVDNFQFCVTCLFLKALDATLQLEDVGLGLKDFVAESFSVCLGGILVEYAQLIQLAVERLQLAADTHELRIEACCIL